MIHQPYQDNRLGAREYQQGEPATWLVSNTIIWRIWNAVRNGTKNGPLSTCTFTHGKNAGLERSHSRIASRIVLLYGELSRLDTA